MKALIISKLVLLLYLSLGLFYSLKSLNRFCPLTLCKIRHGLILLWFKDLVNVTEKLQFIGATFRHSCLVPSSLSTLLLCELQYIFFVKYSYIRSMVNIICCLDQVLLMFLTGWVVQFTVFCLRLFRLNIKVDTDTAVFQVTTKFARVPVNHTDCCYGVVNKTFPLEE